jgi:predicted metal-dependent phosphoesterase TrpH
VIDLHTHTTASDGTCAPAELVARAAAAGVTVLAVTDHDTVAACEPAGAAAAAAGLSFVTGIEITAVREEKDVHVLGYFVDPRSPALQRFLAVQRQQRLDRIRQMVARLGELGVEFDSRAIFERAAEGEERAIGRPWIARALVAAGQVATIGEAFERWLAHGRPAFVPRAGAPPGDVFARIHEAGGIASLAHPGLTARDAWIPDFAAHGLDALEAYHSEHDEETTARYLAMAERLGLAVSGGSDYHGDTHGPASPGAVSLPQAQYDRLIRLKADAPRSR